MYVVEASAAVSLETMKITVLSSSGSSRWTVDVLPEFTIDKLKLMALGHFYNPMDSIKVADRYKLIRVSDGRPLADEDTVRDESILEDDELLLLKRRLPPKSIDATKEKEEKALGPSDTEIQKYTSGLNSKNMDVVPENQPVIVDFHSELRKILVSLVQTSEKVLRNHPDIVELFKEVAAEEQRLESCCPAVDPDALRQLTEMGFPREQAVSALSLNCNAESAAEWLLSQSGEEASSSLAASESASVSETGNSEDRLNQCSTSHVKERGEAEEENEEEREEKEEDVNLSPVAKMLHCFRAYKRKIFKPNRTALCNLKEMGFVESDILDALRIHSNNQDSACEWLLSDKKLNFDDIDKGLDPEGAIYRAIMENPVVQLGLCKPQTFLALLHMLENPNSACRWLSDPDTAPILSQIFRIYHAEKHSLQLARPFIH